MYFADSPMASLLVLALCSVELTRPNRLRRALADAVTFVEDNAEARVVDQGDMHVFMSERLRTRQRSFALMPNGPSVPGVSTLHATIVDTLIDLRAYARTKKLRYVVSKLDSVIRIAADEYGPRDQSSVLVLHPAIGPANESLRAQPAVSFGK